MISNKNNRILVFTAMCLILCSSLIVPYLSLAEIESPTKDWENQLNCWQISIIGTNTEGKLIVVQHKEDYSRTISKFDSEGTETHITSISRYGAYSTINSSDWIFGLTLIETDIVENITINALNKDFNEFSGNISNEDLNCESAISDSYILTSDNHLYICDNVMEYNSDEENWEYTGITYIYKKKIEFITSTIGEQTHIELRTSDIWNISFLERRWIECVSNAENDNIFLYISNLSENIYELLLLDANTGETKWVKQFDNQIELCSASSKKMLIVYYEGERYYSPLIFEMYDENKEKIWEHRVAINNDILSIGGLRSNGDKIIFAIYDQSTENNTVDYGIYILNDRGILQTQLEWTDTDEYIRLITDLFVEDENFYYSKFENPLVCNTKLYKYSFEEITKTGNSVSILIVLFTLAIVSVIKLRQKKIKKI